jgi:hypothetical protein
VKQGQDEVLSWNVTGCLTKSRWEWEGGKPSPAEVLDHKGKGNKSLSSVAYCAGLEPCR